MDNEFNKLYEKVRFTLLSTEAIDVSISEIRNKKLKARLDEMLKTCQADMLILAELVFELSTCFDETDIDFVLSIADENGIFDRSYPVQ